MITSLPRWLSPVPHVSELISQLVEIDSLKTWSVIVTLFGDLKNDRISGAQVRRLLGTAEIKPEAIRVALHRLKNDGWIHVEKEGREAHYRLSAIGHQETATAARDVYRTTPKYAAPPQFVLMPPQTQAAPYLEIAKDVVVVPPGQPVPPEGYPLHVSGQPIPAWLEHALVSPRVLTNAKSLSAVVTRIMAATHDDRDPDQHLLRLLVLHHWRRIALRSESWLHMALLPEGAIANCHRPVSDFLERSDPIQIS